MSIKIDLYTFYLWNGNNKIVTVSIEMSKIYVCIAKYTAKRKKNGSPCVKG